MPNQVTFSQTLQVKDHCLCLAAQRAARALARRFDEAFKPLGITNGQFSLLMALNRPEPPPLSAVASLLAMDRTTLTANLKPLERRGLLAIQQGRDDKRVRLLKLTEDGQALLAEAHPIWTREHARLDEELAMIAEPLRKGLGQLG